MNDIVWTVVGLAAASLTSFSFLPQVRKMLLRRSVGDISIFTIYQMVLGNSLWLTYGIGRRDFVIIAANVVAISILLYGVYLYYSFREKKRGTTPAAVHISTPPSTRETSEATPASPAELPPVTVIISGPEKPAT